MKFEIGKKYKHISGDIFDCLFVTPRGHPVMKAVRDNSEGLFTHSLDNFKEYVEPRSGTRFMNIYDRKGEIWSGVNPTREQADQFAQGLALSKRIACIEVPWVEGQGL